MIKKIMVFFNQNLHFHSLLDPDSQLVDLQKYSVHIY